jgi:hypothetical protein
MKKMLFFLLCTSLTDATGLSIPISIDSAISRLHFTGSANNITAVATNFLRLHPDLTSNTPISTIFDDLVSTMSIHATLAPGETFCHPVAADANYLPLAYTSRTEPFYYPIENAKS